VELLFYLVELGVLHVDSLDAVELVAALVCLLSIRIYEGFVLVASLVESRDIDLIESRVVLLGVFIIEAGHVA
jgi:hypothetical protein